MPPVSLRPTVLHAPAPADSHRDKPAAGTPPIKTGPPPTIPSVPVKAGSPTVLSTAVSMKFNSPDAVKVLYWKASEQAWRILGKKETLGGVTQMGSLKSLEPSNTAPGGYPEFIKVMNLVTKKEFIVGKGNASIKKARDGTVTISIEDRPGSKTPGGDIVLTLKPKFKAAPAPAPAPAPFDPSPPARPLPLPEPPTSKWKFPVGAP